MSFRDNYKIRFTNQATAVLRSELLKAQTFLRLQDGTGDRFPELDTSRGEFFILTIVNPWTQEWEIVKVIDRYHGSEDKHNFKDTLKIVRAQEGTTAKYFPAAVIR